MGTGRRDLVYNYIVAYCTEHNGFPPSYREITEGCGLKSTSVAVYYVKALVAEGQLRIRGHTARSIQVVGSRWIAPGENT